MANAIKTKLGTTKTFTSSGGDVTMNMASINNGAGRISARADILGAATSSANFMRWKWAAKFKNSASPTVGYAHEIYMVPWDDESTPSRPYGNDSLGSSDAAFSTENYLRNLIFLGAVEADVANTTQTFIGGSREPFFIPTRYISLVYWNRSGGAASATGTDCAIYLTPVYDEIQ